MTFILNTIYTLKGNIKIFRSRNEKLKFYKYSVFQSPGGTTEFR